MSLAQQTADEAKRRRIRLMRPPNAVADVEIDLRRTDLMSIDAYRAMQKAAEAPLESAPGDSVEVAPVVPAIPRNVDLYVPPKFPTMKAIQSIVCRAFQVKLIDVVSHRRTKEIMRPRQVCMYLIRTMTMHTLPQIGRHLGDRDHTTVLHGFRKIEGLRKTDADLNAQLIELEAAVTGTIG